MHPSRPRICLDLTALEMRDRYGGFARYGLALAEALLADETAGEFEWLGLPRSNAGPMPLAESLHPRFREGPLIAPRRHRWQRLVLVGRQLRAHRVALFHSLTPAALPLSPGCPVVSTAHDLIPLVCPDPRRGLAAALERADDRVRQRLRYRRGHHFMAISHTTARDLERELGLPPERIAVIHLGIDPRAFSPSAYPGEADALRQRWKLPARWFLAVGSDHPRKNQRLLFEAWVAVASRVEEGLVVVGRSLYGETFRRLEDEAASRGLQGRFRWLSDVEDGALPAFYRQATALVAPSLYEGFGLTLLEAMACGCPVLASQIDAHLEVVGPAAATFDAAENGDLRERLVLLSASPSERAALAQAGLRHAASFTWAATARKTLEVYRKIAAGER